MPTVDQLLGCPGLPVQIVERTQSTPSKALAYLQSLSGWLTVRTVACEDGPCPRLTITGGNVQDVAFIGVPEGRLLEALIVLLHELGTGRPAYETPGTPGMLRELTRDHALTVVASPVCPFCPAVLGAALRFAQATPRLRVTVVRAGTVEIPKVQSVPTVLLDGGIVATGAIGEYELAERVVQAANGTQL